MEMFPLVRHEAQPSSERTHLTRGKNEVRCSYTALDSSGAENGEQHLRPVVYLQTTTPSADLHTNETNTCATTLSSSKLTRRWPLFTGLIAAALMLISLISIQTGWMKLSIDNDPIPILSTAPALPFPSTTHPEPPTALWGKVQKPFPTGAFWTNFAVRDGEATVVVYPYALQCKATTGVHVSYSATRRSVTHKVVADFFADDLVIASVEATASRSISSGGKLSATVEFKTAAATATAGRYMLHAVKSTPFVTVEYIKATPAISSPAMRFLSVQSRLIPGSKGVQYLITLGNYQKWLLYCSEAVLFSLVGDDVNSAVLTAAQPITGVVRVAILPVQRFEQALNALQPYLSRYPTDVKTSISYSSDGTTSAQLEFEYISQGDGPLLTLALPHHIPLLDAALISSTATAAVQRDYFPIYCIKGKMTAIVGDKWKLHYPLVKADWYYEPAGDIPTARMDAIALSLLKEVNDVKPEAEDPYGFGKEIGRMAQLALIADFLGMADARRTALGTLETALLPWLEGSNANPLLYESTYGGICSTKSLKDFMADYGSGWYNDHEFHYGYFLYAAGVIAKLDNAGRAGFFFSSSSSDSTFTAESKRKTAMDALLRDVCNPTADDALFPQVRHKDFFDGHSWASGLFQEANGKGQESSSESINAYYGAYLYSVAMESKENARFALLMLTMELQAARTYWHMENDIIYDHVFSSNRMVGNIGALDVTATTWFGAEAEYVHGIQLMPLTPITALLFDANFVSMEYPVLQRRLDETRAPPTRQNTENSPKECAAYEKCAALALQGDCCPNAAGANLACCARDSSDGSTDDVLDPFIIDEWRNLIFNILAVADRESAWDELLKIDNFGSGNSKSNSLLWAATRSDPIPNFNLNHSAPADVSLLQLRSCEANSACDATGMIGDCCPTAQGDFLGCCPKLTLT